MLPAAFLVFPSRLSSVAAFAAALAAERVWQAELPADFLARPDGSPPAGFAQPEGGSALLAVDLVVPAACFARPEDDFPDAPVRPDGWVVLAPDDFQREARADSPAQVDDFPLEAPDGSAAPADDSPRAEPDGLVEFGVAADDSEERRAVPVGRQRLGWDGLWSVLPVDPGAPA